MISAKDGFLERLRSSAAIEPDRVYARFNGKEMTIGALDRSSSAVAQWLRQRGLRPGDRVAVMMRNSAAAVFVIFGLAKAGIVWVPINVQQRGDGLQYLLSHSRPRLLIHDAVLGEVVDAAVAETDLPRVRHGEDNASDVLDIVAGGGNFDEPSPAPSAQLAIMYTSGTTGRPKGVIVTHRMLFLASKAVAVVSDIRDGDVFLVWEPFFHVGGAQLLSLPLNHAVVLGVVDRFSASRFWDDVRREGATHIHYLGGILQILLKQPASSADRDHRVRIAWGGGCPADTGHAVEDRFGLQIRECYGMTEASSITTVDQEGVLGSVGRPVPWLSVAILDEAGQSVAAGQRGEIVVSARDEEAIFPAYFDNPEATARALKNGSLHTGDFGSFDAEGRLFFHGRMTDSARCRGENVSAYEVEHVAAQHPDVADCAMIGVAADVGEQDIKLFVQPREGSNIEPTLLSKWLQQRLASYQVPRYIAIVDEFERTASQRIMKHRLSSRLDDGWDRLAPTERSA